jgi:molybdate transport system ATP-binding protein
MIVKQHDMSASLTLLQGSTASLKVPLMNSAVGEAVRLRIRARDVAVALEPPSGTSFQNILMGNIQRLEVVDNFLVDVSLNVGFPLLARVTIKAKNDLGLTVGQKAYALIKSMSISAGTLEDWSTPSASAAAAPD